MTSSTHLAVFPTPDATAQAHSQRLVAHLMQQIQQHGPITLGDYIHQALYTPGLGYYAAGAQNFGEQGDFITAPELGNVFAGCCAKAIARVTTQFDAAVVLEVGAGSGRLAFDVLTALDRMDELPAHYRILEVSAELRARQEARLATLPAHVNQRIEWLQAPPADAFDGVIIGNEVVDALAFERFTVTEEDDVLIDVVNFKQSSLCLQQAPASDAVRTAVRSLGERLAHQPRQQNARQSEQQANQQAGQAHQALDANNGFLADNLDANWPLPYTSELRLDIHSWLASVTSALRHGAVLLIDYGSDYHELYSAERSMGTALCHFRHRAHDDLLWWPGLQDITAWVDFSQLADSALALGFEVDGYTTQAHALIDFGLDQVVAEQFEQSVESQDVTAQMALAQQVKQLTLPGEMGERFKAIAFSRGVSDSVFTSSFLNLAGRL